MSQQLHRLLSDEIDNNSASLNQYTAAGFVVWYCFVVMCCGVPIICLSIWFCCRRCRVEENESDEDDLDMQISQIEANVNLYSEIEKVRKKSMLDKACEKRRHVSRWELATNVRFSIFLNLISFFSFVLPQTLTSAQLQPESRIDSQLSMGCAICLGKYEAREEVIQSASCKHIFHQQCILEWLSSRTALQCPCCRQPFMNGLRASKLEEWGQPTIEEATASSEKPPEGETSEEDLSEDDLSKEDPEGGKSEEGLSEEDLSKKDLDVEDLSEEEQTAAQLQEQAEEEPEEGQP